MFEQPQCAHVQVVMTERLAVIENFIRALRKLFIIFMNLLKANHE